MPDNMNPYMDSGMNPNGYMPPYGQPGYPDPMDPYAQQMWDQGQYGMPQPGYPGAPQPGMMDDYMNPGAMASPQDIYANQAAQIGAPGYGMPYDPTMGGMGQPYMDPYGQPAMPMAQPVQPYYDPMQPVPGPGQTGQQAPVMAGQTGQQPPVSPSQTGGFDPVQAAQSAQAEQAAAQAAAAEAQAQQAAQQQQQAKQQAAQQQQQQQQQQTAQQQQQASKKQQKRPQSQVQPMPIVGAPVINPAKATKGRARLALILSILSIILALVPPVGLLLAIIARKIAKSYKKNGGRAGAGDAAAVFSLVGLIFSILTCALVIWFVGYVNGALIGSKAYMNPIQFFNGSPLGNIYKIPTS